VKVKRSISFKIALLIILSLLVFSVVSIIINIIRESRKLNNTVQDNSIEIGNRLINNLETPVWNCDTKQIEKMIMLEMVDVNVYAILLEDEEKLINVSKIKDADNSIRDLIDSDRSQKLIAKPFYTTGVLDINYNLSGKPGEVIKIGELQVYFTNNAYIQSVENIIFRIAFEIITLTVVLTAVLLFFMKRLIIKPIEIINKACDQYTRRNFDVKIDVNSNDEIGNLANNIGSLAMAVDLYNRQMEDLVTLRTEQLNDVNKELENKSCVIEKNNEELMDTLQKLKEAQENLIVSEKMAALGGLVAGIAHEINTPVGIGITASSYLQKKTEEFSEIYKESLMKKSDLEKFIETANESLPLITQNLVRAGELINSFKRVAVDQSTEEKRIFKLNEYLHEILLSLKPKLKQKAIEVKVICDENIQINSYPGFFSQILSNFIINSLIHGFEDKDKGKIVIETILQKHHLRIEYTDDGKGISEEHISKIFDPFYTTNRGGGSTGLGLNIVYNIVKSKLNGNISCRSQIGNGVTFTIVIPIEHD